MKYKINLTVEWDGDDGKRERETKTLSDSPRHVEISRRAGEITLEPIPPSSLRATILTGEKTRSFVINVGSVLRVPLGAPLNRGSLEINPENEQ